MTNAGPTSTSTSTVVWGAVVVFSVTLASIVALAFAVEDGARIESLVGLILPAAGTLLLGFLALARIDNVEQKVGQSLAHTTDLTNGLMDSKIRAAVAEVIKDAYVDPGAAQLLEADRKRRDGGIAAAHPPTAT